MEFLMTKQKHFRVNLGSINNDFKGLLEKKKLNKKFENIIVTQW